MYVTRKQLWIMGLLFLQSIHWQIQLTVTIKKLMLCFMIDEV